MILISRILRGELLKVPDAKLVIGEKTHLEDKYMSQSTHLNEVYAV